MNIKFAVFCFLLLLAGQAQAATNSQAGEASADAGSTGAKPATAPKPPAVDVEMQALESCAGPEQSKAVKDASQQRLMQKITQATADAAGRSAPADRAAEIRRAFAVDLINFMTRERNEVIVELSRLCEAKKAQ